MNNSVFGELIFNTGWKTKTNITLFGKEYNITVKAKAYFEKDGVTAEQEKAYADFIDSKQQYLNIAENLLKNYADGNEAVRFKPIMLTLQRDGECVLYLDDKQDEDDGMAVILSPKVAIMTQDEYL